MLSSKIGTLTNSLIITPSISNSTSKTIVNNSTVTFSKSLLPLSLKVIGCPTCSTDAYPPYDPLEFLISLATFLGNKSPKLLSYRSAQVVIVAHPPGLPSGLTNTE